MTPESTPTVPVQPTLSLHPSRILAAAAAALLVVSAAVPALISAAAVAQTPTMIVVRAIPAGKKAAHTEALPPLTQADITEIKIGGKPAPIKAFDPLFKGPHVVQLMILFDSMQMIGGNGQFDQIKKFVDSMPSNFEIGVGWMLQGKSVIVQPFTTDHDLVAKSFIQKTREQAASSKNDNGNPYSCLKDLAAHWPNGDPAKLRAVLVFTDGITRGNGQQQGGDQLNPDVSGATEFLQRTGVVPYPFFWLDYPPVDPNRNNGGQLEGQTNFTQLTADTGGEALDEGQFAPGTFDPLLNKLYSILASEAVVTVDFPGGPGKYARLDIKTGRDDIKIFGPDNVMSGNVLGKK